MLRERDMTRRRLELLSTP